MARPSGYGSEVLLAASLDQSSALTTTVITASAHQIVTILSCSLCSTGGNSGVSLKVGADYLLYNIPLSASETFVWNDKVVFQDDTFAVRTHDGNQLIAYVSYILQDWTP